MIINTIENKKIKIMLDEIDLKNYGINKKEFISNSKKTSSIIKKLINDDFTQYNICTYNFQIFEIELILSKK